MGEVYSGLQAFQDRAAAGDLPRLFLELPLLPDREKQAPLPRRGFHRLCTWKSCAAAVLRRVGFIAPSALEFAACRRQRPQLGRIEQLLELCRLAGFKFIEFGIFPSEIRPDTVSAEGLGLLRRYVANRRLTFGAQSAVDARLDSIGRGHTSAQIVSAVAAANAAGFAVNLDFIIALPGETAAERRELLEFMAAMRKKCRVHIQLHHFFPLAGSAFARRLPSFLSADERQVFSALKKNGLASDWWQEGERVGAGVFFLAGT